MKATIRTTLILILTIMLSVTGIPLYAEAAAGDTAVTESTASEETEQMTDGGSEEEYTEDSYRNDEEGENEAELAGPEEPAPLKAAPAAARSAEKITGSFDRINGKDIATVRYFVDKGKTEYAFAEVTEKNNGYEYSFIAPYEGFTPAEAASDSSAAADANIIAEYYSTTKWDGAVDVSWYNEESSSFEISEPAQLAGLAAVVNGSINNTTPIYKVKGKRSDLSKTFDYDTPQTSKHQNMNEGLPDCIRNKYYEKTNLIAGVQDEAYEGLPEHDFAGRTVYITSDLDMGGADPSEIDHSKNESANAYDGIYPNWTPIGGEYLMDPSKAATMIKASFNGSINGCGHKINNLYCYRWSYRKVGDTAYGYAQGTGLIGMMGSLYDGEDQPSAAPAVRNMSLSGYIYGRRMVGGFVGCMGGGGNAASGTSLECGIYMENLANHAEIHCTDSKGLGGIVACSMINKGAIINCYNTGYLDADYAAPSGGIIGANEGMNIFCCYNTGTVYTHGNRRGRGIGCDNGGSGYTVDNCYYLDGCGDDDSYPGYYTYNLAKSVSVNTEALSDKDMANGTLLQKLNVNGAAYEAGDGGYPVLYWEKHRSGTGNLAIQNNKSEGIVSASRSGSMDNGTVVYLTNEPETGFRCRYYTSNGSQLSGDYVTVNGSCLVKGFFEEVRPGTVKVKSSDVCTVSITKNGVINTDGGVIKEVTDYPVKPGDPVYEGDILMLETGFNTGSVPENEDLIYQASVPDFFSSPYEFTYTYEDGDGESESSETTSLERFTVSSDINGDGITLVLEVKALTAQKMWDHIADTGWYDDSRNSFTLTKAEQLAGLSVLVDKGKTFAGKTVTLGKDISLANDDGTSGKRFWNGIGSAQDGKGFAGTFNGAGHKITDYRGNANGLFEYCEGVSENDQAVIKDLELKGSSSGQNACGIVMKARNTEITGCISYCTVNGTSSNGHSASILGYANSSCSVRSCVNYAEVRGKGYIGGIVGELSSTSSVDGCVNKGNIFCLDTGGNNVGGLIGSLNGQILRSANYGNIRASGRNIGGIAGQSVSAKALIDSCCNIGRVTYLNGTSSYDSLGGIIGFASVFNVKDSFNYGTVEKLNGSLLSGNMGGTFGREARNSKSLSEDVYYLDSGCEYAEAGIAPDDLDPEAAYCRGIHAATSAEFALTDGILNAVNDSSSFALLNSSYPELLSAADTHVHSGGTATCSELAVCDSCGLTYGLFSDKHGGTRLVGARDAAWLTDGYSGDICCRECGEIIREGKTVKADPDRQAVSFIIRNSDNSVEVKTYSVGSFDALKSSGTPIGYSYGSKSSEITAATQYVTLDSVLNDLGINRNDVSSIEVECTGSKSTVDAATLAACNRYYEGDNEYDSPAAFMIAWNTGSGTLKEVAGNSSAGGTIRFGYGISEAQKSQPVGGARLVSPVETVTINVGDKPDAISVSGASVTVPDEIYTGQQITPAPEVVLDGSLLTEGTDYILLYTNNVNAGKAKVIVIGIGRYTGSCSEFFTIAGKPVKEAEVSVDDSYIVYTGRPQMPQVQVTLNGTVLTEWIDYSVAYDNNTDAGTAAVTVTGIGNFEGTASGSFIISRKDLSGASVTGMEEKTYTGSAQTVDPIVVVGGRLLVDGRDYQISFSDNKKVGSASVIITGEGNYEGMVKESFSIVPKKASLSGVTVKKGRKLSVKIRTSVSKTGGTKYAVQYRIKGKKTWKTKYTKKKTITLTRLKAGKKYQIRVRAYTGSYKGAWSAIKTTKKIKK